MAIYLVCVPEDKLQPIRGKLKDLSETLDSTHLWGGVFFLSSKLSSVEIASQLEIMPSGLGIVIPFEISSSSGRARSEIIQWLRSRDDS